MKEIELTQGYFTQVDDSDFDNLNQYKWHVLKVGKSIYAVRNIYINQKVGSMYMHREIMGNPKGILIDHWEGNGLNNQRYNLRESTRQQNAFNTHDIDGQIPYKGVYPHFRPTKDGGRFAIVAKIRKNGKSIWLGTFKTEKEAARAYDRKAIELFGEFACTNFHLSDYAGIVDVRIRDSFPSPI